MNDENIKKTFYCSCGNVEHSFVIDFWDFGEQDDSVFASLYISKNKYSFFKRIVVGFKYIFGIGKSDHFYEEVLLNNKNVRELRRMLAYYKKLEKEGRITKD